MHCGSWFVILRQSVYVKGLTEVDDNDIFLQESWGRETSVFNRCYKFPRSVRHWRREVDSFNLVRYRHAQRHVNFVVRPSAGLVGNLKKDVG